MGRMHSTQFWTQTAVQAGDIIANTTTATNFATNGTLPANALRTLGRGVSIRASGLYDTDAVFGHNMKWDLMSDAVVLCTSGSFTPTLAGAAGRAWNLMVDGSVRVTGAAGSVWFDGRVFLSNAAGTAVSDSVSMPSGAVTALDTTVAHTLQIRFTWSFASASNSIVMNHSLGWIGGYA